MNDLVLWNSHYKIVQYWKSGWKSITFCNHTWWKSMAWHWKDDSPHKQRHGKKKYVHKAVLRNVTAWQFNPKNTLLPTSYACSTRSHVNLTKPTTVEATAKKSKIFTQGTDLPANKKNVPVWNVLCVRITLRLIALLFSSHEWTSHGIFSTRAESELSCGMCVFLTLLCHHIVFGASTHTRTSVSSTITWLVVNIEVPLLRWWGWRIMKYFQIQWIDLFCFSSIGWRLLVLHKCNFTRQGKTKHVQRKCKKYDLIFRLE